MSWVVAADGARRTLDFLLRQAMQAVLTHLRFTEADTAASLSRMRDFALAAFDADSDA